MHLAFLPSLLLAHLLMNIVVVEGNESCDQIYIFHLGNIVFHHNLANHLWCLAKENSISKEWP